MEIIKPLRLGVLHRTYSIQQQSHLCVTVAALVALGGRPVLLPEQELWELVEEELGADGLIDLLMPKPAAEYLVSGIATTRHQAEKTRCAVEACVGNKQKRLTIYGDRFWLGGTTTAAQPFDIMPLDRTRAYGGPAYTENPLGIGHAPELVQGQQVQRVPNIEHAHQLLGSPRQIAAPAGLGSVDITAPSHMALMGQYDAQWLQQHAPGFPPSFDWHYFNIAPLDQQWRGQDRLPAGLDYRFQNMHPELPVFSGSLPMAHARCFVTLHDTEEEEDHDDEADSGSDDATALIFDEIALRLTTAWFIPHEECAILLYHGSLPVEDEQASNIAHLMPAFEDLATPRSLEHYEAVLAQRLDADDGDLYIFDEAALISEPLIGLAFDTEPLAAIPAGPLEQKLDARLKRMRQQGDDQMQAAGLAPMETDPAAHDLPGLQRLADLPQFDAALRRKEAEVATQMQAERQRLLDELRQRADEPIAQGLLQQLEHPERAPPFDFSARHAQLQDMAAPSPYPTPTGLGAVLPPASDGAKQLRQLYLHSVAFCSAAPALSLASSAQLRTLVLQRYALDRDLSGMDLTGADLSGLNLKGARLTGALLESANLEGCILDDADLGEAILARARLIGCSLRAADLQSANLSHAIARQACFAGALIADADWWEAEFSECDFTAASISALTLQQSEFNRCRFDEAVLLDADFNTCTFNDVRFDSATLTNCNWQQCRLESAAFDEATLDSCSLLETDAIAISFIEARLNACYAALDSDLTQADFSHATLEACNLRDTLLTRASLTGADLEECDLSGAQLQGADLSHVNAAGCLLSGAVLLGARLAGANLMQAMLRGADLRATDLSGAHLFEADMALTLLDASTVLDQVRAERVNIHPRANTGEAG